MDVQTHVKLLIGDLIVQIAQLKAENDMLRQQLPVQKKESEQP